MSETPVILPPIEDEVANSKAPLMEHLIELRSRLIKSVMALVVGAIICIPFLRHILDALVWPFALAIERYNAVLAEKGMPLMNLDIIATHPLETFFVKLKLALFGGCLLYTSPSPRDRTRSRMPSSA